MGDNHAPIVSDASSPGLPFLNVDLGRQVPLAQLPQVPQLQPRVALPVHAVYQEPFPLWQK